ncbi:unnamed protein product [Owenia fusiformis]|uniref:Uncharacterized protein n=1 Tax=Owenia fusiformis TaxID=6347 RepID=A0A8J1XW46_OWEFU|nr:unnamed protein product [Owenia fusiformis]
MLNNMFLNTGIYFAILFPAYFCETFQQAYYKKKPGHIYHHGGNGTGLVASTLEHSEMQCLIKCTKDPQCFNVNFKEGVMCDMYGLADGGWYETNNIFDAYATRGSDPKVVAMATTPDRCASLGLVDLNVTGSCYYIDTTKRNVLDGQHACQSHIPPMDIVSIEDEDEYDRIMSHICANFSSSTLWNIGLNDIDVEMQYTWFGTGATPIWTNWDEDEGFPAEDTTKNCVSMKHGNGRWLGVGCNLSVEFTICEYINYS